MESVSIIYQRGWFVALVVFGGSKGRVASLLLSAGLFRGDQFPYSVVYLGS